MEPVVCEVAEEGKPLPQCKNQLEHEGGAFWCRLPIGHAGPHEPPPHEAGGMKKRERAPPKRFDNEYISEPTKKTAKRNADDDLSDDDDTPPRGAHGGVKRNRLTPKRSPTSLSKHAVVRSHGASEPAGYLTEEQIEARKQFAAGTQIADLQVKLTEDMRFAGWIVVPKRANALETGHFLYVMHPCDPDEAAEVALVAGNGSPDGAEPRYPFFTSSGAAETWWMQRQKRDEHSGRSGDDDTEPAIAAVVSCGMGGAGYTGVPFNGEAYADGQVSDGAAALIDTANPPVWLAAGTAVEVLMDEDGLRSSRYVAKMLEVDGLQVCASSNISSAGQAQAPSASAKAFGACTPPPCDPARVRRVSLSLACGLRAILLLDLL